LLSANSRAACVVCSLGAAVTLVCLERRRRLGQEARCRVATALTAAPLERPAGGLACSRVMPCVQWCELGRTLRARCAAVPPPRGRAWSRRGDGGCSAGPTTVSAALGVGVASSRWAPRPTRQGCLAAWRARRRRHVSRREAEVAGFSARRRTWRLLRSCRQSREGARLLCARAQCAQQCNRSWFLVAHARRDHTHTTGLDYGQARGDITHHHPQGRRSSGNICVLICGPVGLGSAF